MKYFLLTFYVSLVSCLLKSISVFACKDFNQLCGVWARDNECVKNPKYMNVWCKESCGKCSCVDKHNKCEYWSKNGECEKSKKFMSMYCRRSCRKCVDENVSQWSTWKPWSRCTKPCGKGEQRRERICEKGKCKGSSFETRSCNTLPCAVDRNLECGKQIALYGAGFAEIGRVVGGKTALPGEFPWQVGLVKARYGRKPPSNELPFCGGTLIRPNIVLTAAHCFQTVRYAKDFFVRVGDHDMNSEGQYEKMVVVEKLIKHKEFNIKTYKEDIAIIVLKKTLSLNKHVNLACLPDKDVTTKSCTVTGWGRTSAGGFQAKVLQKAPLPIVDRTTCNTAYKLIFPDRKEIIGKNMLCAGYEGGLIDACQGDSGGPLVCKQSNGKYAVNGIVSWGVGCAEKGRYGVYTNTYNYMNWIESQLEEIRKDFPW